MLFRSWRQGIVRSTRWAFWHHLIHILIANPAVAEQYLAVCPHNEHFLEYRELVRLQIEAQLAAYRQNLAARESTTAASAEAAPAKSTQLVSATSKSMGNA